MLRLIDLARPRIAEEKRQRAEEETKKRAKLDERINAESIILDKIMADIRDSVSGSLCSVPHADGYMDVTCFPCNIQRMLDMTADLRNQLAQRLLSQGVLRFEIIGGGDVAVGGCVRLYFED